MMLDDVIAILKSREIAVPPGCDERRALELVDQALAPLIVDTSGRDWTVVDYHDARLRDVLKHPNDYRPTVIDEIENDLVEAVKAAAIGFVFFSDVRAARPHREALRDLVAAIKEELRNVPVPGAIRVR